MQHIWLRAGNTQRKVYLGLRQVNGPTFSTGPPYYTLCPCHNAIDTLLVTGSIEVLYNDYQSSSSE